MSGLQSGDNALFFAQQLEPLQGLFIAHGNIACPPALFIIAVLRAYPWIVKARSYAVSVPDLPGLILKKVGFRAVQYSNISRHKAGTMPLGIEPSPAGFDADKLYLSVSQGVKEAYGIATTTHAGQSVVG